ncbi:MAG: MazG-like family protein [Weizmannia coagulans]|jgi:NTP pyrophosphatase (non-canonical NTP hydrolase)|nr:MazG-like family protein [Heyndrickxia coagulans]
MDMDAFLLRTALDAVESERKRQNEKWGRQRHDYGDWLKILVEEVGEVAQAMQKDMGWGKESDAGNLFEELVHTAAVAVAIAEQVYERGAFENGEGGAEESH